MQNTDNLLVVMGCIIQDILLYLKDTWMLVGYLMLKDSKSQSGNVFTLVRASVSWKSSKQMVMARSTMEYEFIALDKCGEGAE